MTYWIGLWKLFFVGTIVIFAVMAVLVTVGGARDIRKLLRSLRDKN